MYRHFIAADQVNCWDSEFSLVFRATGFWGWHGWSTGGSGRNWSLGGLQSSGHDKTRESIGRDEQVVLPDYLFAIMDVEKVMDQPIEESKKESG